MRFNLTQLKRTIRTKVPFMNRRSRINRMSESEKQLRNIKLIRYGAIGAFATVIIGIIGFFGLFAWYSRDLPKPGEVARKDGFSTQILDRNGKVLYDLYDDKRRTPIKIADVPQDLKNAVVAVEDKDFYSHGGFDILTLVRIPYNFVFKQRVIGGSTLTQQLVKNALLTNERSLPRKFKEFVLSLQIERTFTKDQILEMYLNEAPYGGTAWGVGTAAEIYFDKSVNELNLVESAILAGLPQRPSAYSPHANKVTEDGEPLWKFRTKGVLRRMYEDKHITDLAYQDALSQLDAVTFKEATVDINAPHFVFYVRDQLAQMYGEDVVDNAGFKVTTSLDMDLQQKAQAAVTEEVDKVNNLNITNGAAVVIDPKTGQILSMIGSKDYNNTDIGGQFNVVVDGLRQPGSSIKPLTYLALFKKGYSPASMLVDAPTVFAENDTVQSPYAPKNYDGTFRGPVNIRNSLGSSLNIPAVKALAIVGLNDYLTLGYEMGLPTFEPTKENLRNYGLAATLGGADVHMIELASAYSAFANGGTKIEPVSILKVADKDGRTIYEHKPTTGPTVMTPGEAFLINHILSDNSARAMAFGTGSLLNINKGVAVKTGTTNSQKDNWAIGWSQNALVAAWVGNNDSSAMKQVASGVSGASPIWRRIMQATIEGGYQSPEWKPPSDVEQVEVDAISGYPKHDEFPARFDYVLKGSLQSLPDPIHTKLKLCRGENKLATDSKVAANDFEEKEFIILQEQDPVSKDGKNRWQEGIEAWKSTNQDSRYKPPTEYCGDQNEIFIELKRPENEKKYDTEDIDVEVRSDAREGIEKIEIIVNGSVRETVNNREYNGKIRLTAGRYEVWAKAYSRDGKTKESNKAKIGTGGRDWKEENPQPSPSPSPTPTPLLP